MSLNIIVEKKDDSGIRAVLAEFAEKSCRSTQWALAAEVLRLRFVVADILRSTPAPVAEHYAPTEGP